MATTTPTPPAGAAGAASAAAKISKDPLDDISAGVAWFAIYAKRKQIRGTAVSIWQATMQWLHDYSFERGHLWAHRLRYAAVVCALLILGLAFKVVPENLRTAEYVSVTAWCLGICVATFLATWIPLVPSFQVRTATMADLHAHREPFEAAELELAAAEAEDLLASTPVTQRRVQRAGNEVIRTRNEYEGFLAAAGPSNRPVILLSLLLLGTFIRYGFALKAAAEHFAARGVSRAEYMDLMWAAGADFFLVIFGIIGFMYAASGAGAVLAEIEHAVVTAKLGVQAVLTPGGETVETLALKRRLTAIADGSDPDRLAVDVLTYRVWQSCVSVLVAAFGQFIVFWQNVNHTVSINSFVWSWSITAVELLIYWGVRDPTLRQKKVARWLRLVALTSLIPSVHYALMGRYVERQGGEVVRGPASAWLDHGPIAWLIALYHWIVALFEGLFAFLASPLQTTWGGIAWYARLFYNMDGWAILGMILKVAFLGALVFYFLAPKLSEALEKIKHTTVKKVVAIGAVAILAFFTLAIAKVTAKSPVDAAERPQASSSPARQEIGRQARRWVDQVGRSGAIDIREDADAREARNDRRDTAAICRKNIAGHPPCSQRCYDFHHMVVDGSLEHERELGYCYLQ